MRVHATTLKTGIQRTPEFEKKGLAQFSVNVGTKCGHGCLYCSTGAMLRMHTSFRAAGENPFASGYAIVDPETPSRVARDAESIRQRGLIQLCTTVDAWSPEAQEYNLGRKCLEAILSQSGWNVRILTKNAAITGDFEFLAKYRDRVLIGLSLTATPDRAEIMKIIEPSASPIQERMAALQEAHHRGFRTYGMLCPLLPGIADSQAQIDALVQFVLDCGADEIFVEPVNSRGPSMKLVQDALMDAGYLNEAAAISHIRRQENWSRYVVHLLRNVQESLRLRNALDRLRFLLYPSRLTQEDREQIERDDAGVRWLGK